MSPPNTPVTIAPEKGQAGSENCLPLGTRLAEFEITGIIGEGGFGIVYQAFDHSLRRTVAIKEYMPSALAGRGPANSVAVRSKKQQETFDTGLKSFIHEARLLARFDHPALIKVYRFWEENRTAYMAMRCYQGVTLKTIVDNESAPVTEAWLKDMLRPLLEALDVLYQAQILHRDISPDNIIIQGSGEPVLLDFGAARQIIGDMTQALTVILKPGYAPIEQYADDPSMKQGPWTDIYSLSAVVYSLITRKLPPTSVARMIKDPIECLADGAHPGFSPRFLAAIDKGLAVRPELRPQSIDEFRKLLGIEDAPPARPAAVVPLAAAREDGGGKQPAAEPAKPKAARAAAVATRRAEQKRLALGGKLAWAAVVLGIMLIGGSGGYLLQKRGSQTPAAASASASASVVAVARAPVAAIASIPKPATGNAEADDERNAWEALYDEVPMKPESVSEFLRKYPSGKYAALARTKLAELNAAKAAGLAAPRPADTKPAPSEETAAWEELTRDPDPKPARLRAFLKRFPNGEHAAQARLRLAEAQARRAAQGKTDESAQAGASAGEKSAKAGKAVRINVKPWGNVLVDGTERGVSPPLKSLTLTEGKHQIRIVNPSFPDHVIDVDTSKRKLESIEHDFSPVKK